MLTRHDTFMVLACDGLWNALPEQQVVAYVQRRLNLRHTLGAVAEGLVAEAMQPSRCAHDNVTVVVVQVRVCAHTCVPLHAGLFVHMPSHETEHNAA